MPRYRFVVEYLGTGFLGWQTQPGGNTVQDVLEKAFSICLRRNISITGAGRTDAGVHARGQVAHFDVSEHISLPSVLKSVNALTPHTVSIRRLEECGSQWHARYSAMFREYAYSIHTEPSPLLHQLIWVSPFKLDIQLMKNELAAVEGEHDFLLFSVPRNDGKSTVCRVTNASLSGSGSRLVIHLTANRFLHKMVRSITGACFDVGRGRHLPGLIKSIFSGTFSGERTWAPPCGLCLERVGYPDFSD